MPARAARSAPSIPADLLVTLLTLRSWRRPSALQRFDHDLDHLRLVERRVGVEGGAEVVRAAALHQHLAGPPRQRSDRGRGGVAIGIDGCVQTDDDRDLANTSVDALEEV